MEFISIAAGLFQPLIKALLLRPLTLDMYAGEAGQVRRGPIAYSLPWFNRVSVSLENTGKLQLTGAAFSL